MLFRHFYLLSHYICNGLLFLFSVFWLHVNEFNSFWEELRRRGQKSTACSEDIFVMEFYLPVLTLHLQWFILFIFCVLAPEGMDAIVFGKRWGRGQKVVAYSIVIFTMLNFFLFLYFGSRRNECTKNRTFWSTERRYL